MKRNAAFIVVITAVVGVLTACGNSNSNSGATTTVSTGTTGTGTTGTGTTGTGTTGTGTTPAGMVVSVTTAQLLANFVLLPSDTATPIAVNAGMFSFTDTSDTTTPISVNGT
jgi:hypothetical protein